MMLTIWRAAIINAVIDIKRIGKQMKYVLHNIFQFYYQGFKGMTVGRKLWIIILVKLAILYLVLKLFFFPDFLKSNFKTDEQRSNHVIEQLTK